MFQFVPATHGAVNFFRSFAKTTEVSRNFLSSQVQPVITYIVLYIIYSSPWEDGSKPHRTFPLHYTHIRGTYRHQDCNGKCNTPVQKRSVTESILPLFHVCLQFVPLCSDHLLSSITDRQSGGTSYH